MPDPNIYTIGWICAVEVELIAARAFLDKEHEDLGEAATNDNNSYTLGQIGRHNVVIATLPQQYGTVNAATVARDMVRSFPNIRIGLMVGIGGGAPNLPKHDIRLGDIVVSSPGSHTSGGVFQYDYGRAMQDGTFTVTGHLDKPPQFLLAAMSTLNAQYQIHGHHIEETILDVFKKYPRLRKRYRKPDTNQDRLYQSSHQHANGEHGCADPNFGCGVSNLVTRLERSDEELDPTVHFGIIASANTLMKDATVRDKFSTENDVLCFEMEAAGLMNHFPCLVVRGICDYSDTHKNKDWQGYAAMAAAAYTKDLLNKVPPNKVEAERKLGEILSDSV